MIPRARAANPLGSYFKISETSAGIPLLIAVTMALLAAVPIGTFLAVPAIIVKTSALVVFTVGLWATGLLHEPIVSLSFFLLAVVFEVAPQAVIFSGFQSPAWWLVFGGAITGIAVKATGLGERMTRRLFGQAASYRRYVAAVAVSSVALAFVMPSTTGRVLLLTPMVLALADRLGLAPRSNGRTGLVMTMAAASYMPPTAILPANIPNGVLLGAAESIYGIRIDYLHYLVLHFPVLGALKTLVLIWLVCHLFPEPNVDVAPFGKRGASMTSPEKALATILMVSLGLFATDSLHHVSPAWISLGAGIACLLPTLGIVSPKSLNEQMHITPLVYVAGFLGVGALISHSGLGELVTQHLLSAAGVAPGEQSRNTVIFLGVAAVIGLLTTLPGLPAVLTPLAGQFSAASGLPVYTVLMLQVPAFSTVFLPYQSPPMMIAMHLGGVSMRSGTRLCLALALLTVAVLLPLDYCWYRLVGLLQ